jgi:hypothetical protein
LEPFWEGEREFSGGVDVSEQDVSNGVSCFVAAVPLFKVSWAKDGRSRRLTACTKALTDEIQGIATGVPDCITTTVEGFAVETAEIRASICPGRDMSSLSEPSVSQSACSKISKYERGRQGS